MNNISHDYIAKIRSLPTLSKGDKPRSEFKIWENSSGLSCYYAPFEYINKNAKIVLVGITPGATQMNNALNAANIALTSNTPIQEAIRRVKREGSFSGTMRLNIVNTLNRLGYQQKLSISCASKLWDTHDHLVHFCSLLKFPVFLNEKDYNGIPKAHKDNDLKRMLEEHFVADMNAISHDAMIVPLGETVLEVISHLKMLGLIKQQIMKFENRYVAPPHPSGANAESISLLIEKVYPTQMEYADRMYREYLMNEPWKKKSGKPQTEEKYKSARVSRWKSMLFVRRAYGLS